MSAGPRQDALSSHSELEERLAYAKSGGTPGLQDSLTVSTTSTSASAAFARSLFLFLGLMFRRPSKLFRPTRVDTWGGLRQLALSADQTLSATFIRNLLRRKSGVIALTLTLLPPLIINTTLGFLLFTSHSVFALSLARLPFFQHRHHHQHEPRQLSSPVDRIGTREAGKPEVAGQSEATAEQEEQEGEEPFTFQTLMTGPTIIPRHPTLLSALAGAGAGLVQGLAFTPIENVVRLLHDSASSLTTLAARFLRLPIPIQAPMTSQPLPATPLEAMRTFMSSDTWRKSPSWWTGWRWTVARDALSYGVFFAAFDVTRRLGLRVKALFGGTIQRDWDNVFAIDFGPNVPESTSSPTSAPPPTQPILPILSSPSSSSSSLPHYRNDAHLPPSSTPTQARVAQAITIVAGGVTASILAELAGRPFRTCQRVMMEQKAKMQAQSQASTFTSTTKPGSPSYPASGQASAKASMSMPRGTGMSGINPVWELYRSQGLRPFFRREGAEATPSSAMETAQGNGGIKAGAGARMKRAAVSFGWRLAAVGPWGFGFLVWAWVGGEV